MNGVDAFLHDLNPLFDFHRELSDACLKAFFQFIDVRRSSSTVRSFALYSDHFPLVEGFDRRTDFRLTKTTTGLQDFAGCSTMCVEAKHYFDDAW